VGYKQSNDGAENGNGVTDLAAASSNGYPSSMAIGILRHQLNYTSETTKP
jgi:hypothetical protein